MSDVALRVNFSATLRGNGAPFSLSVAFELKTGVLVLFGPSGAGKTLTLRGLAGLLKPDEGLIELSGKRLFDSKTRADIPVHHRGLAWVPQNLALFPFASVEENVAFGLPRAQRRGSTKVRELLELVQIAKFAKAHVTSLSGGEQQRVALARALAVRPKLLLLDEPFAFLDRASRHALHDVLRRVLSEFKIPTVLVTHNEEEARALADSVVLFERGRTVKQGAPSDVTPSL